MNRPFLAFALFAAALVPALAAVSCAGGSPPTPTPTPTPTVPPTQRTVTVPTHATKAQIDSSVASAVSAGPGTWVVFPAETFAYAGTFTVPDNINIRGQGIWDQGQASGSGGTWLQCSAGMRWGSHSAIEDVAWREHGRLDVPVPARCSRKLFLRRGHAGQRFSQRDLQLRALQGRLRHRSQPPRPGR